MRSEPPAYYPPTAYVATMPPASPATREYWAEQRAYAKQADAWHKGREVYDSWRVPHAD